MKNKFSALFLEMTAVLSILITSATSQGAVLETNWSWHISPIERYYYRKSYSKLNEKQKATLNERFLSADWNIFGTWALLAIDGQLMKPTAAAHPSGHSRFWLDVFSKAKADKQNEFLAFLLKAQLANPSAKGAYGLSKEHINISASIRSLLLDYFNSFSNLNRNQAGEIPDERIIWLAGELSLKEALPILRKVIATKRHFYYLQTDYSTAPEESDFALAAALCAFIQISKRELPEVKTELNLLLKEALLSDPFQIEIENARNQEREGGQSIPSKSIQSGDLQAQKVSSQPGDKSLSLPQAISPHSYYSEKIRTKAQWIQLALDSINGDQEAATQFGFFSKPPDHFSWLRPISDTPIVVLDKSNPNKSWTIGKSRGLEAFNSKEGQLRFSVRFDDESPDHELDPHIEYSVDQKGRILMYVAFFEKKPTLKRVYHIVILDPDNGEVITIFKTTPDTGASMRPFKNAFLLEDGKKAWLQDDTGKLIAERELAQGERLFIVAGERIFSWSKNRLLALDEKLKASSAWSLDSLVQSELSYAPDQFLAYESNFILTTTNRIFLLGPQGHLLSTLKLTNNLSARVNALIAKNQLWVSESFTIIGVDLKTFQITHKIKMSSEIEEWVLYGENQIAALLKNGLNVLAADTGSLKPWIWPEKFVFHPHMSNLRGTQEGSSGFFLKSYSEKHWLARLQ